MSSDHQILIKVKETAYKAQDIEQYLDNTRQDLSQLLEGKDPIE